MALIEGLGDEVTLVLGSFLLIVILLLAWLSTHTEDIPLIREMGVIVVELRQRHRNRHHNIRTDHQAPQEVEISQSSREGVTDPDRRQGTFESSSVESDSSSSFSSTSNEPFFPYSPLTPQQQQQQHQQDQHQQQPPLPPPPQQQQQQQQEQQKEEEERERRESSVSNTGNNDISGGDSYNVVTNSSPPSSTFLTPPAAVKSDTVIPSQSSPLYSSRETDGETLRRRRVRYFETGGINGVNSGISNSHGESVSVDNNNGAQRLDNTYSTSNNDTDNVDSLRQSIPLGASDCDNYISHSNKTDCTDGSDSSLPLQSEHRRLHKQPKEKANLNRADDDFADDSHKSASQRVLQSDNGASQPQSQHLQQEHEEEEEDDEEDTGEDSNFLEGSRIRVKLKYMNETQRFVYASPGDTIGDFRRTHFQSELQDNKWVRFIFNGQDLRDDARTLQACNIENNCTMHCLVTTRQLPGERPGEVMVEDDEESMIGAMMYPLFTFMLLIVWYFRIFYRQYFSAMSTVVLIGISFLLGLSYVSSLRNVNDAPTNGQQQHTQQQQQPQAAAVGTNHPHLD